MRRVWCISDSIISPLGNTATANYEAVRAGSTGISQQKAGFGAGKFWLGRIKERNFGNDLPFFDSLCVKACGAIVNSIALPSQNTVLILSTTKGNIDVLAKGKYDDPALSLYHSAKTLASYTGIKDYQVISNACISGVLAMIVAKRLIICGRYDHALIVGADIVSDFVVSGFDSLMALSDGPCKPFDADRNGINLGEAAAAIVLSANPAELGKKGSVFLSGEAVSNDANHISGPSRTGRELAFAIRNSLNAAGVDASDIGFVSAHGTATLYNDEMEAKAFNLAGLKDTPVNSLKGCYGHTLGAAGVLESVISIRAMLEGEVIGTKGFETPGVTEAIHVCGSTIKKNTNRFLKTASGFGGCNAAVVFEQ